MRQARLHLDGCPKEVLESLPSGMKVDGGFWFWGNKNLTSLPEELEVKIVLWISGCRKLASLPKGLKVGEGLYLHHCESLTSLPQDLQVGGNIFYNSETGFAQIEGFMDKPDIIPTHLRNKLSL